MTSPKTTPMENKTDLSEADLKAALEAFKDEHRLNIHPDFWTLERIEQSSSYGDNGIWISWIRAWELSTQAAYKRMSDRVRWK